MLEADVAVVVADVCQWVVVIHETIRTNTAINPLLTIKRTLLAWMISVVLPTRVQAGQQVNKCRLVQRRCFHLEVTVVARWAPVAH